MICMSNIKKKNSTTKHRITYLSGIITVFVYGAVWAPKENEKDGRGRCITHRSVEAFEKKSVCVCAYIYIYSIICEVFRKKPFKTHLWYILSSVISTSSMSFLPLYPELLGNGCSQLKSHSLLSHSLPYIMGFDIKTNHQRIRPHTHTHHIVIIVIIVVIAMLTLCHSIMLHATLILFNHTSMLTLQIS